MNSRNDNPNIAANTFSENTEFRTVKIHGKIYAQKRESPDGEWENLKMYNQLKNEYHDAMFLSEVKARRFLKKIELNIEANK